MLVDLRPILPGMQLQSLEDTLQFFFGIIVIPTALSKAGNKHDARTNVGKRVGRHGAIDVSPLLLAWFQRQLP